MANGEIGVRSHEGNVVIYDSAGNMHTVAPGKARYLADMIYLAANEADARMPKYDFYIKPLPPQRHHR